MKTKGKMPNRVRFREPFKAGPAKKLWSGNVKNNHEPLTASGRF